MQRTPYTPAMSAVLRSPPRSDVVLATGMTVVCVAELYAGYPFEQTSLTGPSAFHVAIAVALGASLAWRRVYPMLLGPFVFALLAIQAELVVRPNVFGEILVSLLALYGITAYATSWRAATASALACLGLGAVLGSTSTEDPVGEVLTFIIFGTVVMLAGWVVRRQRDRAVEMQRQRDEADERTREIATTERARIARELHDVVAHGMSIVVLQARGGRRMVDQEPSRATHAFEDIERVASDCLDEMRRLLGILRAPDDEAPPLVPQPMLGELPALVDRARASGATVDLIVAGEPRELSPAIELSAYRIAQEALTNSLKHAPGSASQVRVDYRPNALAVEVTDNGPGMGEGQGGHGLIGMRERVELFGGTFHAGSEASGGFAVRALIPLAEPSR